MSTPSSSWLPMVTPDLELQRRGRAGWRLLAVNPALINGQDGGRLVGESTRTVFPAAHGELERLAEQALAAGGVPVEGLLHVGHAASRRQYAARVVAAGLTADCRQQRVLVYLKLLSPNAAASSFHDLVGGSAVMRELYRKIRLYAASDAAVVISGETGSGKELVARAIHAESARRQRPYVAVNCSAMAEDLLESELFGHEKGAFTGAIRSHRGRFERAHGGSLFLDEIGDMPLSTQTRLLRVLEERCVEPLGSERSLPVDVRILCATHVALEQAVAQGRFRSDLYHRISVLRIHLPPLRERSDDIPLLVEQFLQQLAARYQRPVARLTAAAMTLLQSYLWPGNVRELRNVMERIFVENHGPLIDTPAFTEWVQERRNFIRRDESDSLRSSAAMPSSTAALVSSPAFPPPPSPSAELSEALIRQAYIACDGNLSAAARRLGVHRATLYRHLKKMNLDRSALHSSGCSGAGNSGNEL